MRRIVLLILALATLLPSIVQAYDVLVLQDRREAAYEEVQKGFNIGNIVSRRLLVLSEYSEVDVARIVREDKPSLILAIGTEAVTATRKVNNLPVVAVMSLDLNRLQASKSNLIGIAMFVPPERYIKIFKTMKTRRVGILYNPDKSGWYISLARQAARAASIELVTREVSDSRTVLEQFSTLANKVDALWMLPDSTTVTKETTEAYFRFSQQQSIPLISFASNYLGLGAAVVLEINHVDLGRQAGAITTALLGGDEIDHSKLNFPTSISLKANDSVLKHLGYSFVVE